MSDYNTNYSRILKSDKQLKEYIQNKDGLQWVDKEIDMIKDKFIEKRTREENEVHQTIGSDIKVTTLKSKKLKDKKMDILRNQLDNIIENTPTISLENKFIEVKNKIKVHKENLLLEQSEIESNTLYEMFSKIVENKKIYLFLYPKTLKHWVIKIIVYILSALLIKSIPFLIIAFFEVYYKLKSMKIEETNVVINKLKNRNNVLKKEISTEILELEKDIIKYEKDKNVEVKLDEINREIEETDKKLDYLEEIKDMNLREIKARINMEKKQSLSQAFKKKESLEKKDVHLGLAYRAIKKNYSSIDESLSIEEILTVLKGYLDSGEATDDRTAIKLYKQSIKEEKVKVLNELKRQEELKRHKKLEKLKQEEIELKRMKIEQEAELQKVRLEEERKERERKIRLEEEQVKLNMLEQYIKEVDKKIYSKSINEYQRTELKEERQALEQERFELIRKRATF